MKRSFLCTLMCLGHLLQWHSSFAQTTATIPLSKDAYIASWSPASNYGNSTMITAGANSVDIALFRTALQVDLSSIPEGAVITSAKLFLRKHTDYTTSGSTNFSLQQFTSGWSEATISYSNQPEVNETTTELLESVNGWYSFDISSDIIGMYNGTYVNHGWMLRAGDETIDNSEEYFYSRESIDALVRPYVEVVYSAPLVITDAIIGHALDSITSDGSIFPQLSGGSGSYSFMWIEGESGASLGTSASLTNVPSGWYGVHVTDTGTSEELFMAFIVGTRIGETTIDFKPGADYIDDAMIYDLIRNGINYGDNNYGTHSLIRSENWTYSSWYDMKTALKFHLWMDPAFSINRGDLYLYGKDHYPLSRPNTSEIVRITEDWKESEITYNTRPSTVADPLVTISGTSQGSENKVIDMRSFWNEWAIDNVENYGVMLQLQLYNDQYTRMRFHSSDAVDSTTHPWIQFKLAIPVSVSWNNATELGSVQLDISSLSAIGPYHYMISRAPIEDLTETYGYLKDTIGMQVDSLEFFTGNSMSDSHIFNSVEAGTHYVAVFDANGNRIFDQTVDVYGDLVLETASVGLSSSKNNIRANLGETGVGSVELYTVQGDDIGFVAELDDLSASSQYVGLANNNVQVNSFADLEYGVHFDGTNVRTIQNGSLSEPFSVNFDIREVQFQIVDDVLVMKANQQLLVSQSLPSQYTYKLGVGVQDGASISILNFNLLPYLHRIESLRFKPNVIRHLNCSNDQLASISFSVASFFNGSQFNYTINHEETGQLVSSGTLSFNSLLAPVTSFANSDPLLAGTYVVQYSFGAQSYTGIIELGYEADWAQRDPEYTEVPNTYSLLVSGHNEQSYLQARSSNVLGYNQTGWIEFTPVVSSTGYSLIRPTTLNINDLPGLLMINEEFFYFHKQNAFNNYYKATSFSSSQGTTSDFYTFNNTRIKLLFDASTDEISVYANDILKHTIDRGNSSIIARFNSMMNGDGFKNVITSFPCPEPTDMYAHLKYKLDGFYHIMKNGHIKFLFDQEYDADNLKFNIYNQNDVLVKTQADYPALGTTYGDNYLTIDVSTSGSCIGRGFFYLEVINSKKEKLYLRFFNDYTSELCADYINANQSNE